MINYIFDDIYAQSANLNGDGILNIADIVMSISIIYEY